MGTHKFNTKINRKHYIIPEKEDLFVNLQLYNVGRLQQVFLKQDLPINPLYIHILHLANN